MRSLNLHTKLIVTQFLIASLLGCGGGGGGSSGSGTDVNPSEPANVAISVSPSRFDTGDQTNVTVYIQDIHPDGVMVKIRTPKAVEYLDGSGFFVVGATTYDLSPDFYESDDTYNYLVYFFKPSDLKNEVQGEIRVRYEANGPVGSTGTTGATGATGSSGPSGPTSIGVDVDINDLDVRDSKEFDKKDPKFSPEDSKSITVS